MSSSFPDPRSNFSFYQNHPDISHNSMWHSYRGAQDRHSRNPGKIQTQKAFDWYQITTKRKVTLRNIGFISILSASTVLLCKVLWGYTNDEYTLSSKDWAFVA